jgi:hypothetical protein
MTSKNKNNTFDFYEKLNITELQLICKTLNINKKNKKEIIENIIASNFNYIEWYTDYLDDHTYEKLIII